MFNQLNKVNGGLTRLTSKPHKGGAALMADHYVFPFCLCFCTVFFSFCLLGACENSLWLKVPQSKYDPLPYHIMRSESPCRLASGKSKWQDDFL